MKCKPVKAPRPDLSDRSAATAMVTPQHVQRNRKRNMFPMDDADSGIKK